MPDTEPSIRSVRNLVRSVGRWMRRAVTQPREELNRWQRAARFAYDLSRHGGRQLRQDRAPQMAGALAFRTLFALLPVLIVSMIVVKGLRGTDAFLRLASELFTSLRLHDVRVLPATQVLPDAPQRSITLAAWLEELIRQAAETNLAAVGWVGAAVIAYAAIGLMVTIENSFNTIYRAPQGRPWTRRIPLYWFVLTMAPVALGLTWYLNDYVAQGIRTVESWHILIAVARVVWTIFMTWLAMFAVYMLLPNTNVAVRPALAGAIVATLLIELGKRTLDAYLQNAFSLSHLYGSLGLIPLFMFWVYLMWLAVLFGLEVSATLQMLGGRELETIPTRQGGAELLEPVAVVSVMQVVAERFKYGQTVTARQIAENCALREDAVTLIVDRLIGEGLLHRVDGAAEAVTLARPPERVSAEQLIEVGFGLVDSGRPKSPTELAERLREAQRQLASRITLATLIVDRA